MHREGEVGLVADEQTMKQLLAEHDELLRTNMGKERRFQLEGGGLRQDFISAVRLDALYDAVLPRDSEERLRAEIAVQRKVAEALEFGLNKVTEMAEQERAQERATSQRPGLHLPPIKKGLVLPGKD